MFGTVRIRAISSFAWWDTPRIVAIPGRKPTIFIGRFG